MIKERYVNFEVASLLRDKGFDEPCDNYYDQSSDEPQQLTLDEMYYSYDEFIKAPTQAMACDWLMKNYKIFIVVQFISRKGYVGSICDISDFDDAHYISETDYYVYVEQVYNQAIKQALNFI